MQISDKRVIQSEVKGVKIRVSPNLFQQLTSLPCTEVRYERGLIDDWKEEYNSITARQLVYKEDADLTSRILAGGLKVQPILLHYVLSRIVIPRYTNIDQASHEDIMFLWALFNSKQINWGHVIHNRMKRALSYNARLTYPHLTECGFPKTTHPTNRVKAKKCSIMINQVLLQH
ncbi:uncharacterized protein LOC106772329 [Vigna radiata var. radiata]|uniref:Uncharacterized protein LOC106772329 n=1 Tax=Vigna radiata var. radiata TaxID=3916 RepID=A0A1S3V755_VIGRR|nr:uncharacterized protein LOC106772329 [Vigna radiata var. radiata]